MKFLRSIAMSLAGRVQAFCDPHHQPVRGYKKVPAHLDARLKAPMPGARPVPVLTSGILRGVPAVPALVSDLPVSTPA